MIQSGMRAILFVLLAVGCRRDLTPEVDAMVERACACKDKACAKQVSLDFVELAKANKGARTSGDGEEKARQAGQRFGECLLEAGIEAADLEHLRKSLATLND